MISAYLKVVAERAGEIRGAVRDRDTAKDGSIALLAVEHGLISPRDIATGLASGRRQHQPLTFTKESDHTSPLFYDFLVHNEVLKTAEVFFFGVGPQSGLSGGREMLLYKILLKKAFVTKVEFAGSVDPAAQENSRFPLAEKISLVYESIHWEWTSPKTATDDVFAPNQA